jgi:hypothetical protein
MKRVIAVVMEDVCPRCGSDRVRGGKQDLASGDTLHERYCAACGLHEERLASERDLGAWLARWKRPRSHG